MKHLSLTAFLLTIIIQISAQVTLQMQQVIGGSSYDNAFELEVDADGNIYMAGEFGSTIDFDYGPDIYELTSWGYSDGFVLKTDSVGNLIWVIPFGGSSGDKCYSLGLDNDGNIYVGGEFYNTVDFDPGPGVFNITSVGLSSFIVKLNSLGEFVWALKNTTTSYDLDVSPDGVIVSSGGYAGTVDMDPGAGVYNISGIDQNPYVQVLDTDGNLLMAYGFNSVGLAKSGSCLIDVNNDIWVTGGFTGTYDFDPGPGVFNLVDAGLGDNFIAKYKIDGTFLWAGRYGAPLVQEDGVWALDDDQEGNIYLGSTLNQTVDFDMGPGVANKTATASGDGYVLKINTDGEFVWVKTISSSFLSEYYDIDVDAEQNVYASGAFTYVTDLDPGIGVLNFYAHGVIGANDCFVHKLDVDGNFVWAAAFGGDDQDNIRTLYVLPDNQVLLAGYISGPLDMDPGGNVVNVDGFGSGDIFIEKLKPTACADLTLIIDSVSNASCSDEGFALCHAINGIEPYAYVWETEPYTFDSVATFSEGGFYNVFVTDGMSCVKGTSVLVTGPATTAEIDMAGVLINIGFAPGFTSYIWPEVYNNGCTPATGNYQVVIDPLLDYLSSTIPPDIISGDTLTWFFENITYDSIIPTPQIAVLTPAVVDIGWKLNLELIINAEGDIDETNNYLNYDIVVEGAIDPNDKQVTPQGACDASYVTHNQVLTYTVRFQNTGTAPAVNIVIDDTLSNRINVNSLRVVAASHPMHTEFEGLNIVKFVFNDIYLPDSTENEPESHGYVVFEAATKPSAPDYAIVENSAAIYFDFNEPVITNSVINTLVDEIPIFNYTQEITICESDSLIVGNNIYFNEGVYLDVLTGASGCDSALSTILHVVPEIINSIDTAICAGESLIIGGNVYITAGDFTINLPTAAGCDSIINLHLQVNPIYESFIEATICSDGTFLFNGELLTTSGLYNANLISESGCDSIINLNLQVNPTYETPIEATICQDETYLFNGELLSVAGTYNAAILSIDGCDSIVTLNLSVTTVNTEVIAEETVLTAVQTDATYQWVDCEQSFAIIEGATSASYTPEVTSNYAMIIDYLGCVDTSACFIAGPVNIEHLYCEINLHIFPNPVNQTIQLTIPSELTNGTITIYDTYGNLVVTKQQIMQQTAIINLSTLPSGFYVVQIKNGKYLARGSFVKE